ncbi:hypothetical protein MCUN1_002509 [Malassezia cuniculi]|uniref:DUF726-domain-containing protein n=1 Tax=Malassezia cuniculi TaxID=948313 RepID=A0AAF0EWK6_9BASI|nr:hypothetical protein MCUN1_002509 [Malassezia cuniculi]
MHPDDELSDGWEDMPIEHSVDATAALEADMLGSSSDEDSPRKPGVRARRVRDARRDHIHADGTGFSGARNDTGQHLDVHDVRGFDWRTRPGASDHDLEAAETGYTQLRLDENEEEEELNAATEYLFSEDLARMDDSAAPLPQLAMTKHLLSETQKIAYVGICSILAYQLVDSLDTCEPKNGAAHKSGNDWLIRIMMRLYQHLDIDVCEQQMIESLSAHGILASDLAPSLVATHTIPNPAYVGPKDKEESADVASAPATPATPATPVVPAAPERPSTPEKKDAVPVQSPGTIKLPEDVPEGAPVDPNTAAQIADGTAGPPRPPPGETHTLEGVTTEFTTDSKTITLDLRWTVLCDLFLVVTADSVYDSRSRVLLEKVSDALGLTWLDLAKFEKRITEALVIEEDVSTLQDMSVFKKREAAAWNRRMMMMGIATVGGGLVIGLSAGLLAPVIGAGIGAALGAVGIGGTTSFLGGVGGAALITTTGTLGGATLGGKGMSRRTRSVKTFEFRPIHNHKRVNCIVAVPGFMRGMDDDVTLPFSVIDSVMGDAFGVRWEPEMMQEMGNAMAILWNETLVQGVQQVLAATVAGAMFSALAWPLWLSKLGYLIDNPWSNALERSRAAGLILADVLTNRQLGVRPITLIGYSLGARVIYFALQELSRKKAYGIVQNVYLLGAPVSARDNEWHQARAVVSGRFVNAFSRTDWLLSYLHRAASGGLRSIAGLHPIVPGCGIENVDVTHLVPGHLAYRTLTPLVLGELGFRTTADYFDEPESLESVPEREVIFEQPAPPKQGLAGLTERLFKPKNKDAEVEERAAAALRENFKYSIDKPLPDEPADQPERLENTKELPETPVAAHADGQEEDGADADTREASGAGAGGHNASDAVADGRNASDTAVDGPNDTTADASTSQTVGETDKAAAASDAEPSLSAAPASHAPTDAETLSVTPSSHASANADTTQLSDAPLEPITAPDATTGLDCSAEPLPASDSTSSPAPHVEHDEAASAASPETTHTPTDTAPPATYTNYGLSPDTAARLAAEFHAAPAPRDKLPDWAEQNPWG